MNRILKYILSVLLSALITVYLLFHLLSGTGKTTTLFTVKNGAFNDTVTASCLLFRESSYLCAQKQSGTVVYNREEGEKVSAGAAVASVYAVKNEQAEEELTRIEKKIALLTESKPSATDTVEKLEEEIEKIHAEITGLTCEGILDDVADLEDELTIAANKRHLIMAGQSGFDSEIEDLTEQKYALLSLLGEESEAIYAPSSGYFYASTENMANCLSASEVLSLSVSEWHSLADTDFSVPSSCVGILAKTPVWYAAFITDAETAEKFTVGDKYTACFPDNTESGNVPMILQRITLEGEEALVIFSCSTLLPNFDFSYSQRIEVTVTTYSGYKIPASVVLPDTKSDEAYVFIFKKGFAEMCHVTVLFEKDGYCIVKEGENLSRSDRIILEETNLYDGKLIG